MGPEVTKRMSMMRKKSVVVLLIALLGSVTIANAASGIPSCPPKQCCCAPKQSSMDMMDHSSTMGLMDHDDLMEVAMPHACASKKAAPCCNLESDVQPIELAISTISTSDQYRNMAAHLAADIHIDTPLVQRRITAFRDLGWPKIPKVPIFLQTLSILC